MGGKSRGPGNCRASRRAKNAGYSAGVEIGEEDVRAFALDVADEAERAAERGAAQQDRRTGGKVADQARRQPRQTDGWGAIGLPYSAGRHVRFFPAAPTWA